MQTDISPHRPPATQLRPLHSHHEVKGPSSVVHSSWITSIGSPSGKDTARDAFVELVSQITILDAGEPFCIQDTTHEGYLLAFTGDKNHDVNYSFVRHDKDQGEIPTDFSIGTGEVRPPDRNETTVHTDSQPRVCSFMQKTVKCD